MPRENPDRSANDMLIRHRRELIDSTSAVTVPLDYATVRASNVPLFRDIRGADHQGVRLRVEPTGDGRPLSVRIGRDGAWLDEIEITSDAVRTEFLFVPGVLEPTPHDIEIRRGDELLASTDFEVAPQRKWTIHLVHHSHYDIGYTDPQVSVLASQLAYIDDALELVAATDDWPEESRFRWTIEVSWPLHHWLRTRPQAARDELVRRIREGRIEVNALPFSMHTEAYSFDELAQQLTFAQELRDSLGIEISTAMQTDVPGSTVGLSTLLTDAGIDFLAVAHNYAGRSIPHLRDGQELTRPFWWQAPDGDSLMVWYTDTLHGSAYMEAMTVGFGDGFDEVAMSLPEYLNALIQRSYPYGSDEGSTFSTLGAAEPRRGGYPHDLLHMRVQGAYGDNGPASLLPATIIREWNETYSWPRLVSSTNRMFADEARSHLGDRLDTFAGDWTDWWADGIGSSASALGRNRATQAAIRTAQTLNAAAQALGDMPNPHEAAEFRTAYEEMALFDEHTWGAANPWNRSIDHIDSGEHQWIRKAGFAYTAEERVDSLLRGGIERLGFLATDGSDGAGEAIAVFNPNSWPRTDLVRMFVPRHAWLGEHVALVEQDTGRTIPVVVDPQEHQNHRPLGAWITFLAVDVPAIGYVRYRLIASDSPDTGSAGDGDALSVGNDHFIVTLDLERGGIGGIVHQPTGHNLVDASAPFGFNGYVHDRYTSGTGFNHLSSRMGRAQSWLLGARGTGSYGLITNRVSNSVYDRVTWRLAGQGAEWIETTLTMPRGVPRIHLANRLVKPSVMEKESVYFAFPFAADDPRITFEITGGTAGPESPHVPGSAHHFRAIGHWATVEASGAPAVAWATTQAPLVQVGNIHLPYAQFPPTIPTDRARPGTIYSWALNNIWDTNFPPQQGGELRFDYVIAIDDRLPASVLGRDTGATSSQPLIGLRARRGSASAPDRGSLVTVDDPRVEVTHLTADGDEIVAWLFSHATDPVITRLEVRGFDVQEAAATSFLGTGRAAREITDNGVEVDVAPGALQCVRLHPAGA